MTERSAPNDDHVREVVRTVLGERPDVPTELVLKILDHETAVQFDDKRFEAGSYIRNLIIEQLNEETEGTSA